MRSGKGTMNEQPTPPKRDRWALVAQCQNDHNWILYRARPGLNKRRKFRDYVRMMCLSCMFCQCGCSHDHYIESHQKYRPGQVFMSYWNNRFN